MPTMSDVTVVAQAYNTGGNGGRKLIPLSNGWQILVTKDTTNHSAKFYKSTDNGQTWSNFFNDTTPVSLQDVSLVPISGAKFGYIISYDNASVAFNMIDSSTNTKLSGSFIDSSQTATGNVSLVIKDTGTELHATWSSNPGTNFVIRYNKGIINVDGSVTWGTAQTVASWPSSYQHCITPSIVLNSLNNPVIIFKFYNTSNVGYIIYRSVYDGSNWSSGVIYNGGTSDQNNPSAIFVPQNIAILINASYTNGLIIVGWHGKDSTDTSSANIRCMASSDGGLTWFNFGVTNEKITSGNVGYGQAIASLTFNKNGEIYIVWYGALGSNTVPNLRKIKRSTTGWGTITEITSFTSGNGLSNPSTLCDSTINFSEPLFIYTDGRTPKVGFYGTWTIFTPMTAFSLPSSNQLAKANLDTLRQKVNDFRTTNGIATKVWTDPTIITGVTPVKAIHVNELQSAIDEVYSTNQTNYTNSITRGKIKEILSAKSSPLDYPLRVTHLINALQNI